MKAPSLAVAERFASVTFSDEATGWGIITVARQTRAFAAGGLGAAEQWVLEGHLGAAGPFQVAENAMTGSVS